MLSENLKILRKTKGISQGELAERLHIVRQTISKWEKVVSVPDADMLIRIAEFFETSVSELLGSTIDAPESKDAIAQKLEQLNLLLVERNKRSRKVWRIVTGVVVSVVIITLLFMALSLAA